jgi:hypothetical protein
MVRIWIGERLVGTRHSPLSCPEKGLRPWFLELRKISADLTTLLAPRVVLPNGRYVE